MNIHRMRGMSGIGIICISLLCSCLGESGDMIRFSSRRAVVQETPCKSLWVRDDSIPQGYLITSPELEQRADLREGDCCLVEYRIDYAATLEQGAYPVELWSCDTIAKIPLVAAPADTAKMLDHEQFVSPAFGKSIFMKGRCFLQMQLDDYQPTRKDLFSFTYDPQQPVVQAGDKRLYRLYLRSYKDQPQDTIRPSQQVVQKALVFDRLIEEVGASEKEQGADSLHFVIHYPRSFNTDTTALLWATSDTFSISLF